MSPLILQVCRQSRYTPEFALSHPISGQKKKQINTRHTNIFLMALAGQSSQGQAPTYSRDKRDKMAIYCGIQQKKAGLSQGRVPVCPRDGSWDFPGTGPVLSRTPSRPKCLCLLVFFLPEPKGGRGRGYRNSSCPLEGIALYRGHRSYSIANRGLMGH